VPIVKEFRGIRQDQVASNEGFDSEALPEDRTGLSTLLDLVSSLMSLTSRSTLANMYQPTFCPMSLTAADSSIVSYAPKALQKSKERWFLPYFNRCQVPRASYTTKSKKRKLTDTDIQCSIVDQVTGKQCGWMTTDPKRQDSTSNLTIHHSHKHSIYYSSISIPNQAKKKQRNSIYNALSPAAYAIT
jgi:hypothetical protein